MKQQLLRLQAEAFRRHGLTRDQFLRITPRELRALDADALAERRVKNELEDIRTARLMAAIYNNNPGKKRGKTYSEKDFLPKKPTAPTANSAGNLFAKVKWIHAGIHAQAKNKKKNGS